MFRIFNKNIFKKDDNFIKTSKRQFYINKFVLYKNLTLFQYLGLIENNILFYIFLEVIELIDELKWLGILSFIKFICQNNQNLIEFINNINESLRNYLITDINLIDPFILKKASSIIQSYLECFNKFKLFNLLLFKYENLSKTYNILYNNIINLFNKNLYSCINITLPDLPPSSCLNSDNILINNYNEKIKYV
jgi:hypothetical protein